MKVWVGVDGGGTHTRALALEADGTVVGRGCAGPSNWQSVGTATAVAAVQAAVRDATGDRLPQGIGACLAGVDLPEDVARLHQPLEQAFGCPVAVDNDITAALFSASGDAMGVISSGTGAAVALRLGGVTHRLLALNEFTGPQGGAGDIALMAVRAAVLSAQGAGAATRLQQEIPQALGLADWVALARATRALDLPPWQVACVVAPLTARLATEGDAVARAILRSCGRLLGDVAGRFLASQGLPPGAPVELHGSLLQGGPPEYRRAFLRTLRGWVDAVPRPAGVSALAGAGLFALHAAGLDPGPALAALAQAGA